MKEAFIEKNFSPSRQRLIVLADRILEEYANEGYDLSLRQLYYQFVARDLLPDEWADRRGVKNRPQSYKRLGSLINDARMAGLIDWSTIVDRERFTVTPVSWNNPGEIIHSAASSFCIDKWEGQPVHLEVMVEKKALSGVLEPVCRELGIRFTANKGYPSATILYRTGKRLRRLAAAGKKVVVLHLGDHDPSGIDMTRDLIERLGTFAKRDIVVKRIALNMKQVERYNPPENPAKTTDSRFRAYMAEFGDASWELDALEPRVMANLVRGAARFLRNESLWQAAVAREEAMKAELRRFAAKYGEEG